MQMNNNKGMATLATVSGVLLMVGLFAVSVANSGFGEIKKTQNLMIDAEQRARAKAGLDCAIATISQYEPTAVQLNDGSFLSTITDKCAGKTSSQFALVGTDSPWSLTSSSGFANYGAMIASGGGTASAFKTAGSLVIEGGNSWIPAKGKHVGKEGQTEIYECMAIIAGGDVTIDTGKSTAKFESQLLATNLEKCKEGYSTTVAANKKVTNNFEADILYQQPNLTLFKDKFQTEKSDWASVKAKFDGSITTKTTETDGDSTVIVDNADKCGTLINEKRKEVIDDKKLPSGELVTLWVDGDCDLTGVVSDSSNPVSIVVKDGVIAYNGSLANFNGSIFQFNYERENFLDSWLDVEIVKDEEGNPVLGSDGKPETKVSCTNGPMKLMCDLFNEPENLGMNPDNWKYLPFLFFGSFETRGSYIVDVENGTSKVFGAFKPGYDASVDEDPNFPTPPRVLKGSIHDF